MNRIEILKLKTADIGEENPLPDMRSTMNLREGKFVVQSSATEGEEENWFGKGNVANVLPYKMQDGYNRVKKEVEHTAVVLENEYLKAVFLPGYGGRLWSLYDKEAKRDLLYTNTVLQPCNLAIRNAWFSVGVEFNVGIAGHTPLTCSPMFAELVGNHAACFYEYERIRGVAYGFTAYLPEGSRVLYIRPRIENTTDEPIYTYWWSNIAFPETENTRVIVPADEAVKCEYKEGYYDVYKHSIPYVKGVDVSYPKRSVGAADYFWKIPDDVNKWIIAVDKNGNGLLQYSTRFLKGRKLFVWGETRGGRHWNEFLSEKGQSYLEIQAGLLHTQLEHKPIPPHTVWEWTEGYTYVNGANDEFYGDWTCAQKEGWKQLFKIFANGGADFNALSELDMSGERIPVYNGSGFGALENLVRKRQGKLPISDMFAFPNTDDEATQDYKDLLHNGYIPYRSVQCKPKAYITGDFFNRLLRESLQNPKGAHWYTYLQLGINEYAAKRYDKAREAFERSWETEPSLWARRNLAMLERYVNKDKTAMLAYMAEAYETLTGKIDRAFLVEYAKVLREAGKYQTWINVYEGLSKILQQDGRLLSYYASSLVETDREEEAIAICNTGFVVSDVREGEISLSDLWIRAHAKRISKRDGCSLENAMEKAESEYPVPFSFDFRMQTKKVKK